MLQTGKGEVVRKQQSHPTFLSVPCHEWGSPASDAVAGGGWSQVVGGRTKNSGRSTALPGRGLHLGYSA